MVATRVMVWVGADEDGCSCGFHVRVTELFPFGNGRLKLYKLNKLLCMDKPYPLKKKLTIH